MEPDAKLQYLRTAVEHIDIKQFDAVPLVEAMGAWHILPATSPERPRYSTE